MRSIPEAPVEDAIERHVDKMPHPCPRGISPDECVRHHERVHPGSRNRLTTHHLELFPGEALFPRLARAVCEAGVLPRKELYESWEVARRARRRLKGGRVVDWAAGHGLLAHVMLLIDDTSPEAIAYDPRMPPSADKLHRVVVERWPRLEGRVSFVTEPPALRKDDVVVSCHACGGLTDDVLAAAMSAGASVAVLPCCQSTGKNDDGGLAGWLDAALAIDVTRAARLRGEGYRVWTQVIPPEITPKNRLLVGWRPPDTSSTG